MSDLEKALKGRKKRSSAGAMLHYGIPLLIVGIFLAIVFVGVVPRYFAIEDTNEEIETRTVKLDRLQAKLEKLNELNDRYPEVISDLERIEKAFPSGITSVNEYAKDLEDVATEDNELTPGRQTTEEGIEDKEKKADEDSEIMIQDELISKPIGFNEEGIATFFEIPANLELTGEFMNYLNFTKDIYKKDKFILLDNNEFAKTNQDADGKPISDELSDKLKRLEDLKGGFVDDDAWSGEIRFKSYHFSAEAYKHKENVPVITNIDFDDVLEKMERIESAKQ